MVNESAGRSSSVISTFSWRRLAWISAGMTVAIVALLGGAAVALAVCAPGTSYSVTASAPPPIGNWTDTSGAVWTPAGGFPGCSTSDSASDTNASPTTLIVNGPIPNPIANLNLSCVGCVIDIQAGGSLTLAGAGTIGNGATLRVSGGTLTVASGGVLTFQNGSQLQLNGGLLDVHGQMNMIAPNVVSSGGVLQVTGGFLNVSAPLIIQSGGRLNLSDATVGGIATMTNSGIVETVSGTSSSIQNGFNTATGGEVRASSGALVLSGGGNGNGPYGISSGATLDFSANTYTMTPNGVISGAGTLQVSGATLTIGGVTNPDILSLSSGTLDGAGFLSIGKTFYWDGGTIAGTGGAELAGHASGVLSGVSGPMTLTDRVFNNYGFINYAVNPSSGNSALTLTGTAQFNTYGATEISADGSISGASTTNLGVFQSGQFVKDSTTGTSTISAPMTNEAVVLVLDGTLVIGGNGTHTGAFLPYYSDTTIAFGAPNTLVNGGGGIAGNGNIDFLSGSSTEIDGYYDIGGQTHIANASVTFDSFADTKDFLFDDAGTLTLYDDFEMYGTGTWSAGTITSDNRTFYVDPGASLTITTDAITTLQTTAIENEGSLYYTNPLPGVRRVPIRPLLFSSGYLELKDSAAIINDGLFDIQTDEQIASTTSIILVDLRKTHPAGRSRAVSKTRSGRVLTHRARATSFQPKAACGCPNEIENYATMNKSAAAGTTDVGPDLYNEGGVHALSGTLHFLGSYDQEPSSGPPPSSTTLGPGSIQVGTLDLNGGVLDGAGTLTGNINNTGGAVAPGGAGAVGTINVASGTYTQGAGGSMNSELASSSSYDVLAVGGAATLDGTLNVALLSGFQPANGDVFDPLTYASHSSDFATKNLPTWAAGHGSFTTNGGPTGYRLTAVVTPQSADLDADGLTGPASVDAGAPLSYTIQVKQNGPDPVSGTVTVVNTLPAGVTSASGSGTGWSCGGVVSGTITCTTPGPVPASVLPTLTFSMNAPVSGFVITDSVAVSSATSDPSPSNNNKSVNTTVVDRADMAITKTGPSGVVAGQNIVYTIVVTNNGPSTATGVQVSDPTPANLTFVSNSGACNTAFPCNLGTMTSGQSLTITSTFSTSPSFSGTVTNTATVSATTLEPSGATANNSVGFSTNVGAQADLVVTKSGPSSTNPGQNITYTVVVTNNGPSPATSVVVSDPTPVGIAFVSNSGACVTPYPCSIGTLNASQSATITSTYSVPPNYSGGAITNTATASSAVNDPNSANSSGSATTTVGASADVAVSNSGPASASPGTNLTYTITVSNFGPSGASGVVVSDPTPPGLSFVSASGGGCVSFPCTIGALAVGPPVTITAVYNLPANYAGASPITNTASVSSASDPNSSNNSSTASTTVVAQADLAITKSGPSSIVAGSNISYTITVTNSGSLAAANTFVSDPTPAGLTPVSVSGGGCNAFPCSLGTLASGATVTITAVYNVPSNYSSGPITNTATASTSSPETNTANNASTAVTTIASSGSADLGITKSGPAQVNAEGFADYTITVTNNGPSAATNVVISDPTPSGLSFVSASGACSSFPCTAGTLAPGASLSVSSRYRVSASSGSTVTNTASVSSSIADPASSNNSSATSASVLPSACPQPPNPIAPLAGSIVSSPVTFSWVRSSDATNYVVTINTATTTLKIPTTSNSVTQTLANGDYTWSVLVVVNPQSSCQPVSSASIPFTVCNSVGATVPSVVAATTTGQPYSVAWPAVDGAVTYEVQESADAAFSNPTSITIAGTGQSYTKNVIIPTPFFYRVRAIGPCSQNPGAFSPTVTIVILPVPPLGTTNINIPVPSGSKTPVTFPIHVDGVPGVTTSFFATVDKPWLAVTPTTGIMPPEGVTFTISADPSTLSDGTWTGTVIIVFGSGGVSGKTALDVAPKTSIPVSISLTSPVSPGTLTAPASTAVIIPSVGHLAGLGSQWQSDIRIANITALPKKVQLLFSAGSATSQAVKQTTLSIDAGATTALDDIVRNWFGVGAMTDSSNGVLTVQPLDPAGKPDVSSTKSTVASSRTFNASALGTLGQFIPAVPLANFISKAPNSASILTLQQIAQTDTFRTNLGLVEATGKPASVLVSVFNGAGSKILDFPVNIAAGEQVQLNSFLADKGVSLTNGHIEVQATGGEGKVTAYASVIDSRTTDPLLVSGVPLGGTGANRFVIPGVASLDTAAPWRSDVRVFNGSLTPQTTTLTLYPTGNPSASVSNDVTIQPGEVKALDDIVHSTFNLTNTGGALHVTTAVSVPLVVTARTYDQTSTGTLGQFVQAVTPADAVGFNERSLQLLQMEDSPRYRTNLGLAEVTGKAVTAEVTVILPDSKVAPKVQIPLGAFEYRQFAIISSLGLGNTYNARISVKVIDGQGKITAYGSVIDQKTLDPTFVPAQ